MRSGRQRLAIMGAVVGLMALLAVVTVRSNRPASITVALARGLNPEAPVFALPRIDEEGTLELAALRGRVVVLNFWSSWCIPCREEAAAIEATWNRYRERGAVVVGINVQDLTGAASRFLRDVGATFPNVRDKDNTVYRAYGLTGVPETFFVDRQGLIVRKFPGAVSSPGVWFEAVEEALRR